jgi:excisionase family DNA binding protein
MLKAEAFREITDVLVGVATKEDIAELRKFVENSVRELADTFTSTRSVQRHMTAAQCAAYIGRTRLAVAHLVRRGQIPFGRSGKKLVFDKLDIDRWMRAARKHGLPTKYDT